MNKRSRKTKGLAHRLFALLLCCACLMAVVPAYAIAQEAGTVPTEAVTVAVDPTEAVPVESETQATTAPTVAEETTETTAATENTIPATENTLPAETTSPTEETVVESEVDKLYARLMGYETLEELNAAIEALTEEEKALLEQFTDEQNAALEAKIAAWGGYATDVMATSYSGTFTITNTIETNGLLTVKADGLAATETATYTWEKYDATTQSWIEVKRIRVTGDLYNVAENGSWINVALDGGARCRYRAKVATINGVAVDSSSTSAETLVQYYDALQNGSFESPTVTAGQMQEDFRNGTTGLVWQTTADDKQVEYVNPGHNLAASVTWHGVTNAAHGEQCAEINAEGTGALYQDVLTTPGSTMHWALSHLGRSLNDGLVARNGGTDTMYVVIMPYEKAKGITLQSQVDEVIKNPGAYSATVTRIDYKWQWRSDGNNKYTMQHWVGSKWVDTLTYNTSTKKYTKLANPWENHSGDYKVPDGQYLTRYFFAAGSTGSNDQKVGNHIDNVYFSTDLPPANPGSANLTITKTIDVPNWDNLTPEKQKEFIEAVSFTYGDVTVKSSDMDWNKNVGKYQTTISVTTNGQVEYEVKETLQDVEGYNWKGTESDKTQKATLPDGGSYEAKFTNTYELANKNLTIEKTLSGNMYNENDTFKFTVNYGEGKNYTFTLGNGKSNTVSIPIGATVTITEEKGSYTCTVTSVTPDTLKYMKSDNGLFFEMPNSDVEVVINNEKSVIVDTGITLDFQPYFLILAAVGAGGLMLTRKRRFFED